MLKDKISLLIKSDLTPNLFGKLIVPIITIFFIKVLTQISNIQEFNTYILIISFCSWMSTTFYLWIHNTLMQKIKFTDGNEFSPLIIIFSICSILLFLVIYIWITIVNLHTNYIFACYIFLVLTGLYPVLGNLIRLQRRIWDYNIWEILGVLLRYLLGLLFFTFLDSFTGDKIISLFLGISLGLVIQILYELYKKWSFYMHYIENTSIKTGLRESKAWLSFGLPLIIVSWASYGLTVADRFVLNYLSEAVRIGEYGLANNIGLQVISVFFSAITFSVYPKCITMFDKGEDWREYLSRNIKFAIIIGILVIGLIYLGGDKIMFFLSSGKFRNSGFILVIFSISAFFSQLSIFYQIPLLLNKKTKIIALVTVSVFIIFLILCVLGGYNYGIIGLLSANLFSGIINLVLLIVITEKYVLKK